MFEIILASGIQIFWKKPVDQPQDRYRWVNTVLEDPKGIKDRNGKWLETPYVDPPNGGFDYGIADHSPYYYDDNDCEECGERHKVWKFHKEGKFVFVDYPNDPRLKPGQKIKFETCLVDTYEDDKELQCVKWNWVRQRGIFGKVELAK